MDRTIPSSMRGSEGIMRGVRRRSQFVADKKAAEAGVGATFLLIQIRFTVRLSPGPAAELA